jgi:hypothetical protein
LASIAGQPFYVIGLVQGLEIPILATMISSPYRRVLITQRP